MPEPRAVVIIGGGVIGLSCAYYASMRGFDVTVLERNGPDHDGCSTGNAGMLVPSHFVPLAAPGMVSTGLRMMLYPESPFRIRPRLDSQLLSWCRRFARSCTREHVERAAPFLRDFHLLSRGCYEELEEEIGDFGLTQNGLLMLCETERGFREERELAEMACRLGMQAEILSRGEVPRRDPGIRMAVVGAVYYPVDCHLVPRRFMDRMLAALEQAGVRIRWHSGVDGYECVGGRIQAVRIGEERLAADEFVLAAGSWSSELGRHVGLRIPIQAGKGYSLTLPDPPALPKIPGIMVEAKVAVTPMDSSLRFAGTMEISGLDRSISARRVEGIVRSVCRCFPDFSPEHFDGIQPWSGLRPCSPDGLPYIGRTRRYANLIVAAGHAMMGMSLGPATGKLVGEVLSGQPPSLPLALACPDRYD